MTTVVELDVPADRLGASATFDRVPTFEFQVGGMIGEGPPLVWVTGPDRETVRGALEADPTLEVIAHVAKTTDGRWLVRLGFGEDVKLFQQIVSTNDGAILEANGRAGTWSVKLLFHERRSLSDCHDVFETYGFDATVTSVREMNDFAAGPTPLTKTQYETVLAAYELGYFDVPRKVTLQELAAELDVSHQALSERLRRSHAALVGAELSSRMTPTSIDP